MSRDRLESHEGSEKSEKATYDIFLLDERCQIIYNHTNALDLHLDYGVGKKLPTSDPAPQPRT